MAGADCVNVVSLKTSMWGFWDMLCAFESGGFLLLRPCEAYNCVLCRYFLSDELTNSLYYRAATTPCFVARHSARHVMFLDGRCGILNWRRIRREGYTTLRWEWKMGIHIVLTMDKWRPIILPENRWWTGHFCSITGNSACKCEVWDVLCMPKK